MSINIRVTSTFRKDFKKLFKKYRSLKKDIESLQDELSKNPYLGTKISDDFYKIRLQIRSKGKGKSGDGRIISHIKEQEESTLIVFIKLYDKSAQASIKVIELNNILEEFESASENEEE
ncbi:MAG: type II toxin-antitoxin system RelE/ParE family toxin [Bacteroidota bacterium]